MTRPAVRPVVWSPPKAPARSRRSASAVPLTGLQILPVPASGPEDVVVDGRGRVLAGLSDGRIVAVTPPAGDRPQLTELVTDTGGRPLGLELLGDNRLLVCDARLGLLQVDLVGGRTTTLLPGFEGRPFVFCNNAAVAADGTIYFTDSSTRFGLDHWRAELLEHSGTGRLLRRDPDGSVEVVLSGLEFANGVALAPDESWVAVAETGAYRLQRLWLTGPRAGTAEVLVDNLPGFPDNISTGTDGLIWITQASRRDRTLDAVHPRNPLLRKAVWALPERLQPQPKPTVWVLAVAADGRTVHDLQAPGTPRMHFVTGVREHHGTVWLGSLHASSIASFTL